MNHSLTGLNVAILAANGFNEHQMTEIQRALIKAGATTKTIAPETGVMNGWQGEGWGHYFPVDVQIGEALGSDFDALVLPGGERALAKLKTNLHARRIINHFVEAQKPIAAIDTGVVLLTLSPKMAGRTVAASEATTEELRAAGIVVSDDNAQETDGSIITADGSDLPLWVEDALTMFAAAEGEDDVSVAA